LVKDIKKAAAAADKQPLTLNFGTRDATIIRENPLIMNRKSPRVIIVMGRVRRTNTGLIIIFTKASSKAEIIAVTKSVRRIIWLSFPPDRSKQPESRS
jgi:hypothetical protein